MENYDVIIVGGGIAGTGLAYNLSQECPNKSVLVIDKKELGANAGYGYRNTTKEIVKKYGLKYIHIFDGIKVGTYDRVYVTVNEKFYFLNYKKICKNFMNKSKQNFKKETAIDINNKVLITNKGKYSFNYLVDASGHDFFTKKKLNKPIPFRYWIGRTKVLKNRVKLKNYFYHQFSDYEYLEDLYPLGNKTLQGDWQYTKKIDFKLIKPPEKTLYNKYITNPVIDKISEVVIPCTPTPPLIRRMYVCLGDSFGNAYTSSACGIQPIMESSLLLAEAIKKKNLKIFQNQWKSIYLSNYNKFLTSKLDTYHNGKILKLIKNYPTRTKVFKLMRDYPHIFLKICKSDDSIDFPSSLKREFPRHQKLFQFIYWIFLNLKYKSMELY